MSKITISTKDGVISIHSDDPDDEELVEDMMQTIMYELGKKRGKPLIEGKDYTTESWTVKP
jgi:predicted site-specific integrase-resolvase